MEDVAQGTAPTLQLVSRSQANVGLQQQNTGALQHRDSEDNIGAGRLTGGSVLALGQKMQTKSLTQNQGAGAYGFARSEYQGILMMLQNDREKLIDIDKLTVEVGQLIRQRLDRVTYYSDDDARTF